jgi:hypothetical protein
MRCELGKVATVPPTGAQFAIFGSKRNKLLLFELLAYQRLHPIYNCQSKFKLALCSARRWYETENGTALPC